MIIFCWTLLHGSLALCQRVLSVALLIIVFRLAPDSARAPLLITMVELSECNIKLDHSLGCPDDAPNWRLVPGFPIYGVGQPTNDGFNKVIK